MKEYSAIKALEALNGDDQIDPFKVISCFVENGVVNAPDYSACCQVYDGVLHYFGMEHQGDAKYFRDAFSVLRTHGLFKQTIFEVVLARGWGSLAFLELLGIMPFYSDLTEENILFLADEANVGGSYTELLKALASFRSQRTLKHAPTKIPEMSNFWELLSNVVYGQFKQLSYFSQF